MPGSDRSDTTMLTDWSTGVECARDEVRLDFGTTEIAATVACEQGDDVERNDTDLHTAVAFKFIILPREDICYKHKTLAASSFVAMRPSRIIPRAPLLVALVTGLYAFVPMLPGRLASPLGIAIVMLMCIILPGVAVTRATRLRTDDPLEAAAHTCANGLIFLLLCAFVWVLSGATLDAFRLALPATIIVLWVLVPARDTTRVDPLRTPVRSRDRRFLVALSLLIATAALGVLIVGPPMEIQNDTIDHAGYVSEIARTGEAFPITAIYWNPGDDGKDFRKALLHTVYGFTARHTGAAPIDVLNAYGAFLLAVMALVVYTTARALFRRHRLPAVLAVVIFLVGTDWGIGNPMVRAAFYPNRFGAAFLLLFIMAAMEYAHRGPSTALRWCAAYAFAATAVHVQYAVIVPAAAAVLVLWRSCSPCATWGEHLSRTMRVVMAAVVGAAPFFLYRYFTAYRTNPLHEQVQSAVFVTDRWFIVDPARLWHSFGPVGIAALVCIGPLWRRRREIPGVGYTIAAFVTLLVVQLVPFILTPLYSVLKYIAFRLDAIVPFYFLPAYFIATRPRRARVAMVFVLAMLALVIVPLARHSAFSPSALEAERRHGPDRWARGLVQLAGALPRGSVVASDPVTSYLMSAFTPYFVVCTLDQHAPPNDLHIEERMSAARDIVSPFTSAHDKGALIEAYHVSHVVVNETLPENLILNYWTLEPTDAQDAAETFRSLRYEFETIPLSDGLTAFRWKHDERLSTLPRPVPRPVVDALPQSAVPIGERSGEATIEGVVLHGAGILPAGGELVLDLYWSRDRELPPGTYMVTIRFDKKSVQLPLDGRPFPKLTRKLVERLRGERYRFRADHMIQGGLFAPDAWQIGDIVEDDVRVVVPTDIAPGRYRVQAKMLRVANQPNQRLRDYFFDDDNYAGVDIGEVTIRKW